MGDRIAEAAVILFQDGPFRDFVKVVFDKADAWFEEDERVYAHPKDPYKVDLLFSITSCTSCVCVWLIDCLLANPNLPLLQAYSRRDRWRRSRQYTETETALRDRPADKIVYPHDGRQAGSAHAVRSCDVVSV